MLVRRLTVLFLSHHHNKLARRGINTASQVLLADTAFTTTSSTPRYLGRTICCRSSCLTRGIRPTSTTSTIAFVATTTTRLVMSSSSPSASQPPPSPVPSHPSWYRRANLAEANLPASSKVIGTHSGTFQADEAMGVWMIRQLPEYWNARVVRTRDETQLTKLDLVLDVGGVYDPTTFRYDHHQRNYDERFEGNSNRCTKLSASGLVYRHYGKDVIATYYPDLPADQVHVAYIKLYDGLLEALDAIDTGVEVCPKGVVPLYKDATGLAARVSRLNPRWNEVVEDEEDGAQPRRPSEDERFEQAVQLCGLDFVSVLTQVVEADLPAQALVEASIHQRHTIDASGKIVVFANGGMPWRTHLYEAERQFHVDPLIQFVLYQDSAGMWRVQAVTVEGQSFENRVSLPEAWRGLRDDVLVAVTGIPGSRFVHAAGFIGGHDTYEGALAMAQAAVQ